MKAPEYEPPRSVEELVIRYKSGERLFPGTDLSECDLSGVNLENTCFEKHSWFHSCNFTGSNLRGVNFRQCNLKCSCFDEADLTNAIIELATVEATSFTNSNTTNLQYVGATVYGYELTEHDVFPPK